MAWPEGARGRAVGLCSRRQVIAAAIGGTGDGEGGTHLGMHPGNEHQGSHHHTRHMTGPSSAPFRPCPHPGSPMGVGKMRS